jgi:general secretion pathway protein D
LVVDIRIGLARVLRGSCVFIGTLPLFMTLSSLVVRRAIRSLLLVTLTTAQLAHAQVTLNFVNADIDQVAKAIGQATGQTIIVDPRVKGQLNLVADQPMADEKAIKTLEAALRMQGFALLQDHGVMKVVPETDAKLQGVPTYVGNNPVVSGDQVITQVFQLRHESANNLLGVLRPLVSPNNAIAAYPGNNTLVVTDYADNVKRIAAIIAGVDGASTQTNDIVQLKHANVLDLASMLQKLLDPATIGETDTTLKVTVQADPRTNSLLLHASSEARLREAEALIAKLDVATREPGNMHVVQLRQADATELAKTLRGMLGQSSGSDSNSSAKSDFNKSDSDNKSGSSSSSSGSGSNSLAAPLPSGYGGQGGGSGGGGASGGGSGGGADIGGISGGAGGNASSIVAQIQADAATNSLVITASDPVYANLRAVINQLDVRRAQVYIESLIVELTRSKEEQLGVQWQGLIGSATNTALFAGSNFATTTSQGIVNLTAIGNAAAANGSAASALASSATLLNNGLNVGLIHRFGNAVGLGGLLQALESNSDVNILSTPSVITLDNEDAKIVVGQNVPIVTGSYSQTGSSSTVTPFQTFDREDVGITLHVRPQITQGGVIKLQIYQESSSVVASTASSTSGPTINKRSIQSLVLADDGQIIVLGGLMQDEYDNGNSKVPFLGNLPLIGSLFRTENKDRNKTDLMVFLRPVILRDNQTTRDVSMNRYDAIRAETNSYVSDNRNVRDLNFPGVPPAVGPDAPAHGVGSLISTEGGRAPGSDAAVGSNAAGSNAAGLNASGSNAAGSNASGSNSTGTAMSDPNVQPASAADPATQSAITQSSMPATQAPTVRIEKRN